VARDSKYIKDKLKEATGFFVAINAMGLTRDRLSAARPIIGVGARLIKSVLPVAILLDRTYIEKKCQDFVAAVVIGNGRSIIVLTKTIQLGAVE
jgi:hypothetical protein